jgi:ELWxxDGT repeat protein
VTADGKWGEGTPSLWRSNGTGDGTFRLATFGRLDKLRVVPGRPFGDTSLFFVTKPSGGDLWSSDGTTGGTGVLLEDAPVWQQDTGFVVIGSRVYFSGNDGIHGEELWRTDGTASSTMMVADLTGDSGGSAPAQLVRTGNHLFFSAVTAGLGRELYVLDVSADVAAEVADERASVSTAKAAGGEELLLKQAFNLDPEEGMRVMVPGSGRSGLPHFSTAGSSSSRVFRLEFLRHKSGRWVYRPKCSSSLEAGSYVDMTGAETVIDLDADWERVVIEQPLDSARTPRLFGVVEVFER